jgi:hypothetical protein
VNKNQVTKLDASCNISKHGIKNTGVNVDTVKTKCDHKKTKKTTSGRGRGMELGTMTSYFLIKERKRKI